MATNTATLQRNLGYFGPFMRAYGAADQPTRAELYRDTAGYQAGNETATLLYRQVTELLGVQTPPPGATL